MFNICAFIVIYSLYLELTGISKLEDMAKVKVRDKDRDRVKDKDRDKNPQKTPSGGRFFRLKKHSFLFFQFFVLSFFHYYKYEKRNQKRNREIEILSIIIFSDGNTEQSTGQCVRFPPYLTSRTECRTQSRGCRSIYRFELR